MHAQTTTAGGGGAAAAAAESFRQQIKQLRRQRQGREVKQEKKAKLIHELCLLAYRTTSKWRDNFVCRHKKRIGTLGQRECARPPMS